MAPALVGILAVLGFTILGLPSTCPDGTLSQEPDSDGGCVTFCGPALSMDVLREQLLPLNDQCMSECASDRRSLSDCEGECVDDEAR